MLTRKLDPLTLLHKLKRNWDLEPILVKAMDAEEGYGWTFDFACRVAQEYRRFIILCLEKQQDANYIILPSRQIADFWHLHILDTEKYIEDCQHSFGFILHHYCGRQTDQDMAKLREAYYFKTFALYRSTFGKQPPADVWEPMPSNVALAYLDSTVVLTLTGGSGYTVGPRHGGRPNPSHETLSHTVRNKAEAKQWIKEDLDLEPIISNAMDAEKSNGWTSDFTWRVSQEYRRFLVLCLERRQDTNHLIVPSKLVDTFWHLHILDTRKYIEDCQHCFGSILHHFPYFGMRGDQDAINLREAYRNTLVLYQSAFGKHPTADVWPHSGVRRFQFGQMLSRRGGEGGSLFDRSRPRLADLDPSMKRVLPKKSRKKSSLEKKDFIDLMQLASEYKKLDRDGLDRIRILVSLAWKGLSSKGRVHLAVCLCFSIYITLSLWVSPIPENDLPSLANRIALAVWPIILLFFPPPDRGGSGGPPGCGSCGGGCGG